MNLLVSKLDQNRDKQIKKRFEPIDVSSFNRLKFKFFRLNQLKFLRILPDLPIRYLMENFPTVKRVDVNDRTLLYNIEFLLFWGPWAPFDNSWHLRDDYKRPNKWRELGQHLAIYIGYVGF